MTLTRSQLEKYADVLIWGLETARHKPFKQHDTILLRYEIPGLPLAETVYRKLLEKKWNVIPRALTTPAMEKDFFNYSDSTMRRFVGTWDKNLYENLNGNIFISAPSSLTHLKDVDPKRMNEVAVARKSLKKIVESRDEKGLFGWTLCTYPTEELARQAKLPLKEYTSQIVKACFLNTKDPVAKWKEIFDNSMEIKKWLNSLAIESLHMESKSCDLTITPGEKRKFIGISGHNIPSFEIFTSPDWRGTRGKFFANQPSYRSGNYVRNVTLEFKDGVVVSSGAGSGEKFLKEMLSMDEGARRVGEFSLTDTRFSKIDTFMADTLFDENFGGPHGNSHIAIGSSYSDTFTGDPATLTAAAKKKLGFNDSALHWDLVNTEDKRVQAHLKGGKTITLYEKGMFAF
ncbi:MAG TPA: aminopeptidase [Spirochaetota bacterium]|nr:aminopeptidase [Spirochaetota bacterium]HPJ37177.1 aminopeptidase [Spirochaetota bacterium]HPQ52533.1 aminopeptidase [Spirochaetota bacterium]